jgi:hypothetical protein
MPTADRLANLFASAALPAERVADLQRATIQGRYDEMLAVVERIRAHKSAHATPLADELQALIEGFEYDRLLATIEQVGAPAAEPGME